jgi:hypothetical protein
VAQLPLQACAAQLTDLLQLFFMRRAGVTLKAWKLQQLQHMLLNSIHIPPKHTSPADSWHTCIIIVAAVPVAAAVTARCVAAAAAAAAATAGLRGRAGQQWIVEQ